MELPKSTLPRISVVIPTYNRAGFILKTLETVFSQTYPPYEVIVVDNFSTDNTEELLRPLVEQGKIIFIKHDRNYERAKSRNTGMQAAQGDYVSFLDSDDFMYPSNLEDAASAIRANQNYQVFHNLYQLVDPNNHLIKAYSFQPLRDQKRAITLGNFMSCIGVFISKEIYSKYRFELNPIFIGTEDWDFWLQVLADYPVYRINKINSGVVHHDQRSILHEKTDGTRARLEALLAKIKAHPHLSEVYLPYLPEMESHIWIYVAITANLNQKHAEAIRYLSKAYRALPWILFNLRFIRVLQIALFRLDTRPRPKPLPQ